MLRQTPNARRQKVNVVGGSTFGRYNKISSAKTINMYISDGALVNTAGYEIVLNLLPNAEEAEGREIFVSTRGGFLIAVVNNQVFRINDNFAVIPIGMLDTESGEVFIDENLNSQICIVDGLNMYIYNYSQPPNLTRQVIVGNLIPNYVEYHNTFFLLGNGDRTSNGAAWYAYQFQTPTTISQASQLALQTKPDYAIAVVRLPGQGNNVIVFGTTVCEIWTQVGGTQNYRRNPTINIDYGCASVSTIARSDQFVAWLAINAENAPVIMIYTGQVFKPISTFGIDYLLSKIQFPEQSTAMFYRQDGHLLYQLTFYNPADNLTLLYDFSTEQFFNFTNQDLNFHQSRDYAYFNNKTYFVSLRNANLYESSTDLKTYNENQPTVPSNRDFDHEIPRIRVPDTIASDDSAPFRPNSLVITIEAGNDPNYHIVDNSDPIRTEPSDLPLDELVVAPDDIILSQGGQVIYMEGSAPNHHFSDPPIDYAPRVDLSISQNGGITFGNAVGRYLRPSGVNQNILNWEIGGISNYFTPMLRFWNMDRVVAFDGMLDIV